MKSRTIVKLCRTCNKPFDAPIVEVKRGNARYCSRSCSATKINEIREANPSYQKRCKHCGLPYKTSNAAGIYCSKLCKQKGTYTKRHSGKQHSAELYLLPCAICGWKEASRDVHHIIPVRKNGKNAASNLITLCPNHHRMADRNLISQDELIKLVKSRTMSSPDMVVSGAEAVSGN